VWISGQWEALQKGRKERELERLCPHRNLVAGEAFFALSPPARGASKGALAGAAGW
jgi:hypothetical protein